MLGHRVQLFLDQLKRTPKCRAASHRLFDIEGARIEPHRIEAREPAHRARKLNAGEYLLAPVALDIDQNRIAGALSAPPAPLGNRHRQARQQHIVDPGIERRRYSRQQRSGHRCRQRHGQMAGVARDVAIPIKRAIDQGQRRCAEHRVPEAELLHAHRVGCGCRQPLRPAPQRRALRQQLRRAASCKRPIGRRQIRHDDPPRHAIHRKMMNGQQQPSRCLRPGVEPHCPHHRAGPRRKPAHRAVGRLDDAVMQRRAIEPDNVHALQTARRRNCPRLYDLQAPLAGHFSGGHAQSQRVVMIENRLQARNQLSQLHALRQTQQHGLMEVFDRAAALHEPAHDRRRRQRSDGNVGRCCRRVPRKLCGRRQGLHGLMLEHRPRCQDQSGSPRAADELDGNDAVAAEFEEVIVDTDVLEAEDIGEEGTEDFLLRGARVYARLRA